MDNDDPIEFRIGIFFYLIAAFAFVVFVASDFADKPDFDYFFYALLLFGAGWFFRRKKQPPPRVERFVRLKKFISDLRNRASARTKKQKK